MHRSELALPWDPWDQKMEAAWGDLQLAYGSALESALEFALGFELGSATASGLGFALELHFEQASRWCFH